MLMLLFTSKVDRSSDDIYLFLLLVVHNTTSSAAAITFCQVMFQEKLLVFVAVFLLFEGFLATSESKKQKLLFVLLDGFRWDYADAAVMYGGFNKIFKNGVRAEHMVPIYPAESYPNYFALTTGLNAENSGIVSNFIVDPEENGVFSIGDGKESQESFWFQNAEPIWITATKNHINTACYEWPLTNVTYDGITPKITTPYKFRLLSGTLRKLLRKAVDVLASGEIDFVMVYSEFTDFVAHALGPFAMKYFFVPFVVDAIIFDFYIYFKEKKLEDKVNVVFVSDHGMKSTDLISTRSLRIEDKVDLKDVKFVIDRGSHMGVYPVDGKEDKVYNQLKTIHGVKVYKRDEIPESYRLKNNRRVPPIYIEVLKGFYLLPIKDKSKRIGGGPVDFQVLGYHGYNPIGFPDMWGSFFAAGPAFKKGVVVPPINNVDVYGLLCHLLGVKAKPNNGTWDNVKDMLNNNLS